MPDSWLQEERTPLVEKECSETTEKLARPPRRMADNVSLSDSDYDFHNTQITEKNSVAELFV